jgi:putative FmdB family regulatory protein
MPNYEYECKICGNLFDHILSVSNRLHPRSWACPNCKQSECLDLKIGTPGFMTNAFGKMKPPSDVQQRLKDIGKDHKKITGKEMVSKFGH